MEGAEYFDEEVGRYCIRVEIEHLMASLNTGEALMWEAAEKMRRWVNVAAASIGIHLALVAVRRWFLDAALV